MKRLFLAGVLMLGLVSPAFAYYCPSLWVRVDAALAEGPKLAEETLAEIKKLRALGEKQHDSGEHDQSIKTLNKALELLKQANQP